jgi:hypothetical protein
MKALARDRESRYGSAAELQRALDGWGGAASELELAALMTELFPGEQQKTRRLVATRLANRASPRLTSRSS